MSHVPLHLWSSLWKKLYVSHHKSLVSARKELTVHIKRVLSTTGQAICIREYQPVGIYVECGFLKLEAADIYNQKTMIIPSHRSYLYMFLVAPEKQMASNGSFHFFLHTIFCHYHSAGDVTLLSMSYKVALPEALSDSLFCKTMHCRSITYWNENWKRKHLSLYIVLPWGPKI